MTLLLAVKILGIWVFLALIAIINGAVRDKLLVSLIGQRLALPLSGVSLSLLIFLVTLIFAPFLAISSPYGFWQVGIIWVLLTLAFELNSESIPRCLRRGWRANKKQTFSLTIGDSPQLVAGNFNSSSDIM